MENLKQLIEAFASRFDRLENLIHDTRAQQQVSAESFEEFQQRFAKATRLKEDSASEHTDQESNWLELINNLKARETRIKSRDLHEVELLEGVLAAKLLSEAQALALRCIAILYTAKNRSWKKALGRKDLEERIRFSTQLP